MPGPGGPAPRRAARSRRPRPGDVVAVELHRALPRKDAGESPGAVVVLPAPLAPRITTTSPRRPSKSRPWSTCDACRSPTRRSLTARRQLTPGSPGRPRSPVGSSCTSAGAPSAILRPKSITTTLSEMPITSRHVVLDQQHGEAELVAHRADDLAELVDLAVGQPGGRLVEEQQLGVAGQRPGQLDALERAVRQAGGRAVGEIGRVRAGRGSLGRRARDRFSSCSDTEPQHRSRRSRPCLGVCPDHHVLEHRHRREERQVLEGAGDAERSAMPCAGTTEQVRRRRTEAARPWARRRGSTTLNIVVLPAPFGPIKPQICPRSTSNVSSSSATMPPNETVISLASSSGIHRLPVPTFYGVERRDKPSSRRLDSRWLQESYRRACHSNGTRGTTYRAVWALKNP